MSSVIQLIAIVWQCAFSDLVSFHVRKPASGCLIYDCKVILVGKLLRRSLDQPLVQSKVGVKQLRLSDQVTQGFFQLGS